MGLLETLEKHAKKATLVGTLAVAGMTGYADESKGEVQMEPAPIVYQQGSTMQKEPVRLTEKQLQEAKEEMLQGWNNPASMRKQVQEKDAFIAEYLPKQIQDMQQMNFDERQIAWRTMELEAGSDGKLSAAIGKYVDEKEIQAGHDAVARGKPILAKALNGSEAMTVARKIADLGNLKVDPNAGLEQRMKDANLDHAAELYQFVTDSKNKGKPFFEGERNKDHMRYSQEMNTVQQYLLDYDARMPEAEKKRGDEIADFRIALREANLDRKDDGKPAKSHWQYVEEEAQKNMEIGHKKQNIGVDKMLDNFKKADKNQNINPAIKAAIAANMSK